MKKILNLKVATGFLAVALVGAGCFGSTTNSNTSTTTNTSTGDSTNTVTISNMTFSPASLTVKVGTTVTWVNNDGFTHTVTGDNGGPNGQVAGGSSYSFTFNTAGSFPYHCSIHAGMNGTVTVTQ